MFDSNFRRVIAPVVIGFPIGRWNPRAESNVRVFSGSTGDLDCIEDASTDNELIRQVELVCKVTVGDLGSTGAEVEPVTLCIVVGLVIRITVVAITAASVGVPAVVVARVAWNERRCIVIVAAATATIETDSKATRSNLIVVFKAKRPAI